jgi:predicted deacylase
VPGWTVLLGVAAAAYGLAVVRAVVTPDLSSSGYPSPGAAEAEIDALVREHPERCLLEEIGRSREGRPLWALRLRGVASGSAERPRLLVTAHLHAVEYVGAFVARAVARRLAEGYGRLPQVTQLLDRADVWIVPLLNPDGAERVWRRGGWVGRRGARVTAGGVDPNRNFPFVPIPGRRAWNTGRDRPGSSFYRGPHPLSEPECLALARLCERERFCGAIHFHSFGRVVFMPRVPETHPARRAFEVFEGLFQAHQIHARYRPVAERPASIVGQLDAFLLGAFGTPSVTVEVGRPGLHCLRPDRVGNVFWIANPSDPVREAENDAGATLHALAVLLERTGGRPFSPLDPALASTWEALLERSLRTPGTRSTEVVT